jgi:hypothetical protein
MTVYPNILILSVNTFSKKKKRFKFQKINFLMDKNTTNTIIIHMINFDALSRKKKSYEVVNSNIVW